MTSKLLFLYTSSTGILTSAPAPMPTQYLELRCARTLTHVNTVIKDRIETYVFSCLNRSKGIQHACQNLSEFNQGMLLLSAGQAGEGVKRRLLLSRWTSEEKEVIKNCFKFCQQMPAHLKMGWNKLWPSFKKEKRPCRSLNSKGFSWPQRFPKRQCQCYLKTFPCTCILSAIS